MDQAGVRDLLREEELEWSALHDVLDAFPAQPLTAGDDPWSAADIYAHLARWFGHSEAKLRSIAAGERPRDHGDVDQLNAEWRGADASIPFAAARARAMAGRWRLLTAAALTPVSRWSKAFVEEFRTATLRHYREHREAVVVDLPAALRALDELRRVNERWLRVARLLDARRDWAATGTYAHLAGRFIAMREALAPETPITVPHADAGPQAGGILSFDDARRHAHAAWNGLLAALPGEAWDEHTTGQLEALARTLREVESYGSTDRCRRPVA